MHWRNTTERYGTLSIGLHWCMAVLLVAVYACIELRELFPKGSVPRELLKTGHFTLGLSVLALVGVRLLAIRSGPFPRIAPPPPRWQQLPARLMFVALYGLMWGLPLLGWLLLSAAGKPIPWFGLHLPALMGESKPLADWLKTVHTTGGTLGYYLIGLHAAAALWHHYGVRDNTLLRLLPVRAPRAFRTTK